MSRGASVNFTVTTRRNRASPYSTYIYIYATAAHHTSPPRAGTTGIRIYIHTHVGIFAHGLLILMNNRSGESRERESRRVERGLGKRERGGYLLLTAVIYASREGEKRCPICGRERERQLHRNKFSGMTGQKWFQFVICIFSESGGGARTLYTHTCSYLLRLRANSLLFSYSLLSPSLRVSFRAGASLLLFACAFSPPAVPLLRPPRVFISRKGSATRLIRDLGSGSPPVYRLYLFLSFARSLFYCGFSTGWAHE